jgi:hypothetical protein
MTCKFGVIVLTSNVFVGISENGNQQPPTDRVMTDRI